MSSENLIWIDLEMTGLDTQTDLIIEIATIVTDNHLNILAEGPTLAIHQNDEILAGMDGNLLIYHYQTDSKLILNRFSLLLLGD